MTELDSKKLGVALIGMSIIYCCIFYAGYLDLPRQILCLIAIPFHLYLGLYNAYPKILVLLFVNKNDRRY